MLDYDTLDRISLERNANERRRLLAPGGRLLIFRSWPWTCFFGLRRPNAAAELHRIVFQQHMCFRPANSAAAPGVRRSSDRIGKCRRFPRLRTQGTGFRPVVADSPHTLPKEPGLGGMPADHRPAFLAGRK